MSDDAQQCEQRDESSILIAVIRTGGIAGISRRWHVEPPREEEPRWIALIDRCPWDDRRRRSESGADRYVWSIQVRTPHEERERRLSDAELRAAWRDLVDAVREADAATEDDPAPRA